jgi:hypothetical protein
MKEVPAGHYGYIVSGNVVMEYQYPSWENGEAFPVVNDNLVHYPGGSPVRYNGKIYAMLLSLPQTQQHPFLTLPRSNKL